MGKNKKVTSISDAFTYLLGLVPNLGQWKISPTERTYRLDRMRLFLERLGNPHRSYQIFHVAGTKGKGSTSAFLTSILETAGYNIGLYMSPHVSDAGERISVSIPPSDIHILTTLVSEIQEVIESIPPDSLPGSFEITAFELVTLLAFLYFRAAGCQYAVVETGIGGRYDVTNVVHPRACLLTPVDLEHMEILGNTLECIARDKSGIIKPGIPVFCGIQTPEVTRVFQEESLSQNAPIWFLDEEIEHLAAHAGTKETAMTLKLRLQEERKFRIRLLGEFQAENAALAYLVIRQLFPHIPCETIEKGLEKTFIPGRMELIQTHPPIMLDGAHTPLAAERIMTSYKKMFSKKGILIFGSIVGKSPEEMAKILAPAFREIIISTPGYFKKSDPDEVFRIFREYHPNTVLKKEPPEALQKALEAAQNELPILVTGSFFMIAEIRKLLLGSPYANATKISRM